jgi:hypothetical protein
MSSVTRGSALATLVIGCAATVSVSPAQASAVASGANHVYVIQGVPGSLVDVTIDGDIVESDVAAKGVLGPLDLAAGNHTISFAADDWTVDSTFDVDRPSLDVVVHWPADSTDMPEVTVFGNDVKPLSSDKGRLTVAHTAVVPPADILVDSNVLFSNIANGEFVSAVVPANTYSVEVVPTGQTTNPLLGPVDLPVKAGVLTRVFAIGEPEDGSMDAVVQVVPVAQGGSTTPGSVDAGEAGLAAGDADGPLVSEAWSAVALVVLTLFGLVAVGLKRGRASR